MGLPGHDGKVTSDMNVFKGSVKGFGVQIEILASVFDWISKQQLNLSLFLWDWYCRKLELTDLPGHDGKVTAAIYFILSPYYRSFRSDRGFLYESLLNGRLLWEKTWNNEYESEYESVSRISIWIIFILSYSRATFSHLMEIRLYLQKKYYLISPAFLISHPPENHWVWNIENFIYFAGLLAH